MDISKNTSNRYKILTKFGYEDFDGISVVGIDYTHNILLLNGASIRANANHVFISGEKEIKCSDLRDGMMIEHNGVQQKIFMIQRNFTTEPVYDILDVKKHNTYIANGFNNHNCKFIGSSATLVDSDVLEKMKFQNPIKMEMNDKLAIYEQPIPYKDKRKSMEFDAPKTLDDFERFSHLPMEEYVSLLEKFDPLKKEVVGIQLPTDSPTGNFVYVLGVDTAKGVGKDWSVIQVIKIYVNELNELRYKMVATYRSNRIPPVPQFAEDVLFVARKYNNAVIMIENNDVGGNVATMLWYQYHYENIVNMEKKSIGVRSNNRIKVDACLHMKNIIDKGYLEVVNKETIKELGLFEEVRPNVFKAIEGRNDDMVTSLMWALYITKSDDFAIYGFDLKDVKLNESDYSAEELYDDIASSYDDGPLMLF